jgi:hypothetical protein
MSNVVRVALLLISAIKLILAVAFFLKLPFVVALWPFPGTTPLTFIFVASIFAAAGAATLWAAASKQYAALAGIGLDYFAIQAPVAIYSFQLGAAGANPQLMAFGVACVLGALFGLALLLWSLRFPLDTTLPMPAPVRWSFVGFVVALFVVSTQLIMQVPNIIPWKITPELSVLIGWMFFGAMLYFVYALLRPSWVNSAGQLAGFLAYDLVLIVPFLQRLPTVAPEQRLNLMIYTAVVIYSALLATYYLFVNGPTRIWGAARPAALPNHA